MMRLRFALPLLLLLAAPPAVAGDAPDRFVLAVGSHNFDDGDASQRPAEARIEWRMASLPLWKLHPWLGAEFITHAVGWFGAGLETDIPLWRDRVYLTLQTGAGYFDDGIHQYGWRNNNPPTGFEFRHQAELSLQFPAGNRIGVAVSHMSNGGIGSDENPGKNSLTFNVHIPFAIAGRTSRPVE